jgi:hypothetical protein
MQLHITTPHLYIKTLKENGSFQLLDEEIQPQTLGKQYCSPLSLWSYQIERLKRNKH